MVVPIKLQISRYSAAESLFSLNIRLYIRVRQTIILINIARAKP